MTVMVPERFKMQSPDDVLDQWLDEVMLSLLKTLAFMHDTVLFHSAGAT